MGMLQRSGELNFALKPVGAEPGRQLGRKDLDDDLAVESDLLGDKDPAHPAATQLAFEPIAAGEGRLEAGQEVAHSENLHRGWTT